MRPLLLAALLSALVAVQAPAAGQDHVVRSFMAGYDGEAVASVHAGCARCDWGESGRESVALTISLDGRYSQHLQLVRGEAMSEYRIALGRVTKGPHRLTIDRDPALSALGAGADLIR